MHLSFGRSTSIIMWPRALAAVAVVLSLAHFSHSASTGRTLETLADVKRATVQAQRRPQFSSDYEEEYGLVDDDDRGRDEEFRPVREMWQL